MTAWSHSSKCLLIVVIAQDCLFTDEGNKQLDIFVYKKLPVTREYFMRHLPGDEPSVLANKACIRFLHFQLGSQDPSEG